MKKNIKVSIIVPCYNMEKYIEKSISSLINQSLKEIEIICINDGSNDNTLKILKRLKNDDNRIIIVDKKNNGVSSARNDGLDIARGEYIGFLDPDDWVENDCYLKSYNKAVEGNFDIVAFDTVALYPNKNVVIESNIRNDNVSNKELMIDAYAVLWNKIFKREIISDIRFDEKLTFCEDVLFLYKVYSKTKKIGVIHEVLHNYYQRENSITNTYDKKIYQILDSMDEVISYFKEEELFKQYKEELEYTYVRYLYGTFIKRLCKTKDIKKVFDGYKIANEKINEKFSCYKKNKYINNKSIKSLYLKNINKIIVFIIYILEKNKMN